MARLTLEGDTLGKRHQHYNKLLKEAVSKKQTPDKIDVQDNDIDNLLKIDIANNNKDVEYLLEVLKSEDLLYISRAIKRCTWMITDPQYAHIVNPEYLYTQLFPQMMTKACNKLMLHIRLNLKDETRVEDFFKFLINKNEAAALKWLPHCSLAFIDKEIEKYEGKIDLPLFKRLCERSFSIFRLHIRNCEHKRNILKTAMFLLNTDTEEYLDILQTVEAYEIPSFGAKFTAKVMKKCPKRIIDNFVKLRDSIDLETFAKYLKDTDIKPFLLNNVKNESLRSWFCYDNVKYFIKRMPKEIRFEFVKKVFIEKAHKGCTNKSGKVNEEWGRNKLCCALVEKASSRTINIYRWYRFAPFDLAFSDLKKLIRFESSPAERHAILGVLLSCAGRDRRHIHTLLQYYYEKHINEPFKFKLQFVNKILSQTKTHLYDDNTWNILNSIFCSMEVYADKQSENVTNCIQSIIVYKVLHYERVPEIIEKNFKFDTLKSVQKKLNKDEKDKIFIYLYNSLVTKLVNKSIETETEYIEGCKLLDDLLNLLLDWRKDFFDHPWVLNKIKKLIKVKIRNSWRVDLSSVYNKNKAWRKFMFEESLLLSPTEEVCFNALKHNSELLERYEGVVQVMWRDDRISLRRTLGKLRVYWPESTASEWTESYLARLDSPYGHQALVRGLCVLMPHKKLLDIVKKYAPTETKINWNEDDDVQLRIRKQFARNIYLVRPVAPPDVVLQYAQGDYLQYALPSLNAILHNLCAARACEQIAKFLNAPVSLQKHGIRLAVTNMDSKELKEMFTNVWNTSNNSTIRAVVFKQSFLLLCKAKQPKDIKETWKLLSSFIDKLSTDEDKVIYNILNKIESVPLSVRARFCMKSYSYIKSLPAKTNYENILEHIVNYSVEIMESLDPDFVADMLLETLDKKFLTETYPYARIIASYLLCAKDSKSQTQKYEKLLAPLLERSLNQWKNKVDGIYFVRNNVNDVLKQLCNNFQKYVFEKKMIFPVKMFTDIEIQLEEKLLMQNNYVLIRSWKLTVTYIKLLEGQKELLSTIVNDQTCPQKNGCNHETDKTWNAIYLKVAIDFAERCFEYLEEDIKNYFNSIYLLFAEALEYMFNFMNINQMVYLETLKTMLRQHSLAQSRKEKRYNEIFTYLVVLFVLPDYFSSCDEETAKITEIRKMIVSHPSAEIKMHYYKKYKACDLEGEN